MGIRDATRGLPARVPLSEFVIDAPATEVPRRVLDWNPSAFVTFLPNKSEPLLQARGQTDHPVVNLAFGAPFAGRAVMTGDAKDSYATALEHFRWIGVRELALVVTGDPGITAQILGRFQQFSESYGLRGQALILSPDPPELTQRHAVETVGQDRRARSTEFPDSSSQTDRHLRSGVVCRSLPVPCLHHWLRRFRRLAVERSCCDECTARCRCDWS